MKQSFTYSGDPKTRRDAMKSAKKVGVKNFSDLVEGLLKSYPDIIKWREKAEKWDSLGEAIGEYYGDGENEFQKQGDLTDIGEVSATAFGYL